MIALSLLLLGLQLGHASPVAPETQSHVIVLTEDDFAAGVADHSPLLVEFFAPWCGHCKKLKPEFEAAAELLAGVAALATVDCTEHKALCTQFQVQSFPTLKVFRGDATSFIEYTYAREQAAIHAFMKRIVDGAVTELSTEAEVEAFRAQDAVVLIGAFSDAEKSSAYSKLAEDGLFLEYEMGIATQASLLPGLVDNTFVVCTTFDGVSATVPYTGALVIEEMKAFLKRESFPVLGRMSPVNYYNYVERGLPIVWAFLSPELEHKDEVAKAAAAHRDAFSFVYVDTEDKESQAQELGLEQPNGLVLQDFSRVENFALEGEISAAAIDAFLAAYLAGELDPISRSQQTTMASDNIVDLTADTFGEVVFDNSKDVMVFFHAPWSGLSVDFMPRFERIAAAFTDEDSIVVARFDISENDVPLPIHTLPTLYMYPADDKTGIRYTSDLFVGDLIRYIAEEKGTTLPEGWNDARLKADDQVEESEGKSEGKDEL